MRPPVGPSPPRRWRPGFGLGLLLGASLGLLVAMLLVWQLAPRPGLLRGRLQALPHQFAATTRPCPLQPRVVAIFGQSHAGNGIEPRFSGSIPANLLQFDWKQNRCAVFREPLLGADDDGGHLFTPTLVALARRHPRTPVLVVPFASGGSSVLHWAYGYLARQNELVLALLQARRLAPALFLWHQGEKDAAIAGLQPDALRQVPPLRAPEPTDFDFGLRRADAEAALHLVVQRNLEAFPQARFGLALASRCGNRPPDAAIRAAQAAVAAADPRVFVYADTDRLHGERWRYDHCHLNQAAAAALATEIQSLLEPILFPPR